MLSFKARQLQAQLDERNIGRQVPKPKPTIVPKAPVTKPQGSVPQQGQAVDRTTSYMATDSAPSAGPQPIPKSNLTNLINNQAGIVPTTSNSVKTPVTSAPAPQVPIAQPRPQAPQAPITGVTSTPATQTPIAQTPVQPEQDIQQMIEELNRQRLQEQIASLQAAQERALSGVDTAFTQSQSALERAKTDNLTALENQLTQQMNSLGMSREQQIAALEKLRSGYQTNLSTALSSAMSNLEAEEAKLEPFYYDMRNMAAGQSDLGAMNFAQYMAGRGITGAAGGLPEIYRNAALQQQIGALDQQQASNMADIARSRSQTQNEYEMNLANMENNYQVDMASLEQNYQNAVQSLRSQYETGRGGTMTNFNNDLAALTQSYEREKQGINEAYNQDRISAEAGVSAQGLEAYINQMNMDRNFGLSEAQLTGTYGGVPTLQAKMAEAELTGMYDGTPTFAGQQFAWEQDFAERQFAAEQAYRNKQLQISSARQSGGISGPTEAEMLRRAQFEYQQEQDALDREFKERQFEHQVGMDLSKQKGTVGTTNPLKNLISNSSAKEQQRAKQLDEINKLPITPAEKTKLAKSMGL